MSVTRPTWTEAKWNQIKNCTWLSCGGWDWGEEVAFLIIERGLWSFDVEPIPDPDPPPNSYPMTSEDHWNAISGGTLDTGGNYIAKGGTRYYVEAVIEGETRYSRVVVAD